MYELVILSTPAKQLSKFDKHIRAAVIDSLEKIGENPFIGEMFQQQKPEKYLTWEIGYVFNAHRGLMPTIMFKIIFNMNE